MFEKIFKSKKAVLLALAGGVFCLLVYKSADKGFFKRARIFQEPAKKRILRVLTYSSFAGVYGPGRKLKNQFESFCSCEVQWLLSEDSTALLQRLAIVPSVDLIVGLDQISALKGAGLKWKSLSSLKGDFLEALPARDSPFFLPIDWAPVGFLYKYSSGEGAEKISERSAEPAAGSLAESGQSRRLPPHQIASLSHLPDIQGKISFPEPRTSVLGIQLYYWIYQFFSGDLDKIKSFLARLKPKIHGPVFSWSLSYGFFQKGRVSMSLSYLTSLAYHLKEEGRDVYRFARFEGGHPIHVEFAALPGSCASCSLALEFARFLLSPEAQRIIMESHYMLPARAGIRSGDFTALKPPKVISYKELDRFMSQKEKLLALWEKVLY